MIQHKNKPFGISPDSDSGIALIRGSRESKRASPSQSRFSSGYVSDEAAAHLHGDFVHRYSLLLDRAVHRRFAPIEFVPSTVLSDLSEGLGQLRASARDVIELHARVLERKLAVASQEMQRAYLEEGHLLVLELMGRLLSYYRSASLS